MPDVHESADAKSASISKASSVLVDARGIASMLNCSTRHVFRLADASKMPAAVKVGSLVRWNRSTIEAWIAGGCRPVRSL